MQGTIRIVAPPCFADRNGGRIIDLTDLATLLAHFGTDSGAAPEEGEIDCDEDVDLADLAALLPRFGTGC